MPTTKTIVGYLYRGEYHCPACIVAAVSPFRASYKEDMDAERFLTELAGLLGFDRAREHSFSHHDFPHTITEDSLESPRSVCDSCVTELR
jgi:hypothetical protein